MYLDSCLAAVYCNACAGDERGLVGGHEDDRVRDLIGMTYSLPRKRRGKTSLDIFRSDNTVQHAGLDRPRRYDVDADLFRVELDHYKEPKGSK